MNISVVGSGVSGLTCAVLLAEAGHRTAVVTRDLPEHTTSIVAAAVWYPYEAPPIDTVPLWGRRSLEVFYSLLSEPASGTARTTVTELFAEPVGAQTWTAAVREFEWLSGAALPQGYAAGFRFETIRVDPTRYLPYLLDRFLRAGGSFEHRREGLASFHEIAGADVVVNCTGLGAEQLAGDSSVYPIRGQVVAVENPGITDSIIDESDPDRIAYIFPRVDELVLGGTRQIGNADLVPDPVATARILGDAARLEPKLSGAVVRDVRVGLRPGRAAVRVEAETTERGIVIHNYGHAGNGYGLSWGCAEEVVSLVEGQAG